MYLNGDLMEKSVHAMCAQGHMIRFYDHHKAPGWKTMTFFLGPFVKVIMCFNSAL